MELEILNNMRALYAGPQSRRVSVGFPAVDVELPSGKKASSWEGGRDQPPTLFSLPKSGLLVWIVRQQVLWWGFSFSSFFLYFFLFLSCVGENFFFQ